MANQPNLDHPTLKRVKQKFPDLPLLAGEFRGQTTLIVPGDALVHVMRFLRDDAECRYDFLSDVVGIDYLNYPAGKSQFASLPEAQGRFAVVYLLVSTAFDRKLNVKTLLNPTLDTKGIERDPALVLPSVCELWPGAEWPEREVFDMFGIRFHNHPDLRRILLWEDYPAHPLRKDYPLIGRGEREHYAVVDREDA